MLRRAVVKTIHAIANRAGFAITRLSKDQYFGPDPFLEVAKALTKAHPLIFDVGANAGHTARFLRSQYPGSIIHCFEPSPHVFRELEHATSGQSSMVLNNIGLGEKPGQLVLVEHSAASVMSSFLEPGYFNGGAIQRTPVEVSTVDTYCKAREIDYIDLMKVDTQGFDFQVLQGAGDMLSRGRIRFVLCEITLDEMYIGIERFDRVLSFMFDRNYALLGIFNQHLHEQKLSWADVVFVRHPDAIGTEEA